MKFTSSLGLTLSGSQGGVTAARNRGGQYLRRRAVPVNPNTIQQQAVRTALTSLVASWQTLTDGERAAWATYAENTPGVDSLGQTLVLTGQQSYIRCNTPRIAAGLAVIDAAPIVFNRGNPATLTEFDTAGGVGAEVRTTFEPLASAGTVLTYVGRPLSAARNFYKGPYRLIGTTAVLAGGTTAATTAETNDPYGELYVTGQRRPTRVTISYDDGRLSVPYEAVVTVP